jgi:peroxiredoxin
MLTSLCLLSCVWGVGQVGERTEWSLVPQWTRGQELVYRGSVREQSGGRAVQFTKAYTLEVRVLVLETTPESADLGILTKLTQPAAGADQPGGAEAASVRLEVAQVDRRGRLTRKGGPAEVPLDGPPTWEYAFVVEVPRAVVEANQTWTVQEVGRPPRQYAVAGVELIGSTTCVKLSGEQKSDAWDKPRADRSAWRRRDTVWVVPNAGYALRYQREIERREPAHTETTHRVVTTYELVSNLRYGELFFEARRRDITQAAQFDEQLQALLPDHARVGRQPFEALVARIDRYVEKHKEATPYREALARIRATAAAASRGQVPPHIVHTPARERLAVGKPAPEFLVEDLKTRENVTLRKWRGKTVLLVFYQPGSPISPEVLRYAQRLAEQHAAADLVVIGLAMGDDADAIQRLIDGLHLTFPHLAGKSLRASYAVETTPRFVLIDAQGTVRSAHTGWGPEIPVALRAELRQCLDDAAPR